MGLCALALLSYHHQSIFDALWLIIQNLPGIVLLVMRWWFSFLLEVSSPGLDEAQPLLQPKLHIVLVPAQERYYSEIIDD